MTTTLTDRHRWLLWIAAGGLLTECAWIALWPIGVGLAYTPNFTRAYVAEYPLVGQLVGIAGRAIGMHGGEPGLPNGSSIVSLLVVFAMAGAGYTLALVGLMQPVAKERAAGWLIIAFTAVFQLTLCFMPGLFTTDIFSYLLYGRVGAVYGENPYLHPASAFPQDPFFPWIDPSHFAAPSSYGPLWTDLSTAMERLTHSLTPVDQVLVYKLVLNALQAVSLGLLWWLLGRLSLGRAAGHARLAAFAMFAWSPLVLFEVPGNGHNDGLTVMLLLLAIVPIVALAQNAPTLGWGASTVLVGLGALVKYTTAPLGLLWFLVWVRQMRGSRLRLIWVSAAGLVMVAVAFVLLWPAQQGSEVLRGAVVAGQRTTFTPGSRRADLALSLVSLLGSFGLDQGVAAELVELAMSWLPRIAFGVYFLWEMHHVWAAAAAGVRDAISATIFSAARATILLLLLTLATQVQPWYFVVPLALAALIGPRDALAQMIVGWALVSLSAYFVQDLPESWVRTATLGLYAMPPAILVIIRVRRRHQFDLRPVNANAIG